MQAVTRSALLIRPKEPYVTWAASIDEESKDLAEVLPSETSVYLIAEMEDPDSLAELAALEGLHPTVEVALKARLTVIMEG